LDNIRLIILALLTMIVSIEMYMKVTPDKNKKGGGGFFASSFDGDGLTVMFVALASFAVIFSAIILTVTIIDDGAYAFFDKKRDLNSIVASGETPEMGEYVTVRFNCVGKPFYPEGRSGVYYPIVIYDESGNPEKNKICAIHLNDREKSIIDKYLNEPVNISESLKDNSDLPVLEYSGQLLEINVYYGLYEQTVLDSGVTQKDCIIKKYVIDATLDRAKLKQQIIMIGVMLLMCLAGIVTVLSVRMKRKKKGGSSS